MKEHLHRSFLYVIHAILLDFLGYEVIFVYVKIHFTCVLYTNIIFNYFYLLSLFMVFSYAIHQIYSNVSMLL